MTKHCELCMDTGWYGDNGPGIRGNNEYHKCECGIIELISKTNKTESCHKNREMMNLKIVERYTDNGELSHIDVVNISTGEIVLEDIYERQQFTAQRLNRIAELECVIKDLKATIDRQKSVIFQWYLLKF